MIWRAFVVSLFVALALSETDLFEDILKKQLLKDYNKGTAPPWVVVQHQLSVWQIQEVSTEHQRMSFQGWWRHYWVDSRLRWSPAEHGNLTKISVPISDLWLPDVHVYMQTYGTDQPLSPVNVEVYSSGQAFVSIPRTVTFGCNMHLDQFPFDTQTCWFDLGAVTYDGKTMDLIPRIIGDSFSAVDLGYMVAHSEFELLAVNTIARNVLYSCCPNPYPTIRYEFIFRRYATAYVTSIIAPLMIVAIVSILGHFLHPHAGERIGLSVTMLLTSAAIYFVAAAMLPKMRDMTVISRLYIVTLTVNVFTLLTTIIVISLHNLITPSRLDEHHLREIFQELDTENSGELNTEEIEQGLTLLGLEPHQYPMVFAKLDYTNSGKVRIDDWLKLPNIIVHDDRKETRHNLIMDSLVKWGERREQRRQERLKCNGLKFEEYGPEIRRVSFESIQVIEPAPDTEDLPDAATDLFVAIPEIQFVTTAELEIRDPETRMAQQNITGDLHFNRSFSLRRVSSAQSSAPSNKQDSFRKSKKSQSGMRIKNTTLHKTEDSDRRIGRKVGAEIDSVTMCMLLLAFVIYAVYEFGWILYYYPSCLQGLTNFPEAVIFKSYTHLSCSDPSAKIYYTLDSSKPLNLQDPKELAENTIKMEQTKNDVTYTYVGPISMEIIERDAIKAMALADRNKKALTCSSANYTDDLYYNVVKTIVTMIDERNMNEFLSAPKPIA